MHLLHGLIHVSLSFFFNLRLYSATHTHTYTPCFVLSWLKEGVYCLCLCRGPRHNDELHSDDPACVADLRGCTEHVQVAQRQMEVYKNIMQIDEHAHTESI